MSVHFSRDESPPADAYGRVTNAERFQPLHTIAARLLDDLAARYDVVRSEEFSSLPTLSPFEHARGPTTLRPTDSSSAPVSVAFTTFPGLLVRYGSWLVESYPACGCDACDETVEYEGTRLYERLRAVTTGRLREEITIPWIGPAWLRWSFGEAELGPFGEASMALPRAKARALRGDDQPRVQWRPWPVRSS